MFEKILIANRGEIACRVMRTAHAMGIRTVAVYSDADAGAPHMQMAGEAIHIGPAPAAESYLVGERIIEAARRTGAQAIHPGYGFLSENAAFAEACDAAGLVFVGPRPETIRAMGSKSAAKDLMENAGVPTSPGYQGADQSIETFREEAARIGYPVLLKAVSGGGGKGMRLVERAEDLEEAMGSAAREGQNSFGDPILLIEKYITRARHLEVQIVGDAHGNIVHLFERDCSVQRRHQKIIEEAPAPNLPEPVRARLLEAGVNAGRAVAYRGAGTVEFLYDGGDNVYFMEMNTRLQVEHPITEMITGIDLVEWQLRVASGEPLPRAQADIRECGHAFESRLYAENPENDFAPSIGTLTTLSMPGADEGVRLDSGVAEGQAITPFYDPMIAKMITYGADRRQALGQMRRALSAVRVAGLQTNARFLHALASEPDFIEGDVSTAFIADHSESLFATRALLDDALAAYVLHERAVPGPDPFEALTGWRLNRPGREIFWVEIDGEPAALTLSANRLGGRANDGPGYRLTVEPFASADARRAGRVPEDNAPYTISFTGERLGDGQVSLVREGQRRIAFLAPHLGGVRVWFGAETVDIVAADPLSGAAGHASAAGSLTAPMPGTVTAVVKEAGARVEAGETLLVMEAMKMEHAIKAPSTGTIKAIRFAAGQQVGEGELLVEFEPA